MTAIEIASNDTTIRYLKYKGKCFTRKRDDTTGNYGVHEEHILLDKIQTLKNIYGANGDVVNVSSSFLLRFPSAKKHNVKKVLRDQVLAVFKAYDKTSVLSRFEVDTSQHYEDGVYIYLNVSWAGDDIDAVTKSDTLLNNIDAIIANMSTTLPQPFNSVVLSTSLNPVTMKCFVLPTILSITTTYVEDAHNTDVEVKTVGLYDHIGIKINTEDDNEFRRLRNQQITTAAEYYDLSNPGGYDNILNIVGVDPTEDTFIATLFDNDYKKLYTSIQTPTIYIQQTQGTNGDLLNETVDGSITLDLNFNDFTTENQTDFIDTMNSETGGDTTIVNTSEGSAIVEYRVIFDVSKTQQEIDDVVVKLNDDVEIQNIINKSATINGVVARKTINSTTKREQRLTKKAKVVDVVYDEPNSKILFKTIGSYKHILYKATEQDTFESSASKVVDLPPGFTNKLDVKLVDVTDGDITAVKTYSFDTTAPVITLNGDAQITLAVGDTYVEQGATVTDNSGETITPVITGTVNTNTEGIYTITYQAIDSSGNTTSVNRYVNVMIIITIPDQSYIPYWQRWISTEYLYYEYDFSVLAQSQAWCVECWVYMTSYGGGGNPWQNPIIDITNSDVNVHNFVLNVSPNSPGAAGKVNVIGYHNFGSLNINDPTSVFSNNPLPLSQWVHIAWQVDKTNNNSKLYVNGSEDGVFTLSENSANMTSASKLYISMTGNQINNSAFGAVLSYSQIKITNDMVYSSSFTPLENLGHDNKLSNKVVFFLGTQNKTSSQALNLVDNTQLTGRPSSYKTKY